MADERRALADAEAARRPCARRGREPIARDRGASLPRPRAALQRATETVAAAEAQRAALERRRREIAERRTRARSAPGRGRTSALRARSRDRPGRSGSGRRRGAWRGRSRWRSVAAPRSKQRRARWRHGSSTKPGRSTPRAGRRPGSPGSKRRQARLRRSLRQTAAADGGTPILAAIRVAEGFEAAIGALFEDELSAPLDDDAATPTASGSTCRRSTAAPLCPTAHIRSPPR